MKRILLFIAALLFCGGAGAQDNTQRITVGPSETTELMSVIMHLTGAPEYNIERIWPEYRELVDSVFAPYKEHPAVKIARQLYMEGAGMAYSRPMHMAVKGRFENGIFTTPYQPEDYAWSEKVHRTLVSTIAFFYRDSKFGDFYTKHAVPRYEPVRKPIEAAYNGVLDIGWIKGFMGAGETGPGDTAQNTPDSRVSDEDYFVTLCYLNSTHNYGVSRDGAPRPVVGVNHDAWVGPRASTSGSADQYTMRYTMTLLHEYLHPHIDPLIGRSGNALRDAGQQIFPRIRDAVRPYTSWQNVCNEALVRAAVVTYMRERGLPADMQVADDGRKGFTWIGALADKLGEYQNNRDKYPTLESFMPEVVKFYNELAAEQKTTK